MYIRDCIKQWSHKKTLQILSYKKFKRKCTVTSGSTKILNKKNWTRGILFIANSSLIVKVYFAHLKQYHSLRRNNSVQC